MYGAFHPDAQKGGENDTLLTNKAKSGSNSRILVAVGALCAVSGALVGAYALSGSNGYGVSSLMRLGASETCGMDHCLTLLQGCLLYTSPSPRDKRQSRMPSSA